MTSENTGSIARLHVRYGFIRGVSGVDYFFHGGALLGVRFEELRVGQPVAFSVEPSTKGPRATNVRPLD